MEFKYHRCDNISKLAWCTVLIENSSEINVYHGESIETNKLFFVEGTWDDEFCKGNFNESTFFLGSGAKISNERLEFSTSSHTLERLYSISNKKIKFISNSLPFILYMSDCKLDSNYLSYEIDFNSILKGINEYTQNLPLDEENSVQLHYYCNMYINNNFELVESSKKKMSSFNNYQDYELSLIESLKKIKLNAQSSDRKQRYGLITTISKGYDAAACAAIAKEIGCNSVVSFDSPEAYAKDCGEDIAKKLGYENIFTKNADNYLNNRNLVESEFLSSGELGTGIVFTAFEQEFKGNIVFMGDRGDKIWDKNSSDVNNEFRFVNEIFSGTSMIEDRLRVGYILMPMPLYGASQWPSINSISNSLDMEDYSIGGNYDRPIPRRILESRGVGREMFGIEKKGAGFNYRFDNLNRIKKRMSKKSFESFYDFYNSNKRYSINIIKTWSKFIWSNKSLYIRYVLNRVGIKFKARTLSADSSSNPGASSYLFNWGIDETIKKYEKQEIQKWWLNKEVDKN